MFSAVVVTYLNEDEESQLGGCIIIVVIEMTYAAPSSPFPPLERLSHQVKEAILFFENLKLSRGPPNPPRLLPYPTRNIMSIRRGQENKCNVTGLH